MSKILLLERDENSRRELAHALGQDTTLSCQIIYTISATVATAFLDSAKPGQVDLIISNCQVDTSETALEIANYCKNNGLSVPLLILGPINFPLPANSLSLVEAYSNMPLIIDAIKQSLGKVTKGSSEQEYAAMPIFYFTQLESVGYEIYYKLVQAKGRFTYVKWGHREELSVGDQSLMIMKLGLTSLYLKQDDRKTFIGTIRENLIKTCRDESTTMLERLQALEKAYLLVLGEVHHSFAGSEVSPVLHELMSNLEVITSSAESRKAVFELIGSSELTDSFQRAMLIHIMSYIMVKISKWGKESYCERLQYAAYLHDIALKNDYELASIMQEGELKYSNIDPSVKKDIRNHAAMGALLVQQYFGLPNHVERIILEHHGQQSGVGFCKSFSADLYALSVVFIVSEKFATLVINGHKQGMKDFSGIWDQLMTTFPYELIQSLIPRVKEHIPL
jgi:hypothetical protein